MSPTELRIEILRNAMTRLQAQNPSFSLRGLAQRMGVTPAFLSKVFNGKAPLPFARIKDFVVHLKMDQAAEDALLRTYDSEKVRRVSAVIFAGEG